MIRIIIFILIVITIAIIGFNIGSYFSEPIADKSIEKKEPIIAIKRTKDYIEIEKSNSKKIIAIEKNSLNNKIEAFLEEAEKLLQNSKDSEALLIYETILKTIGNSRDPKLLEHFANVWMMKAFIYQLYPNNDKDSAIEAYDMIIEKFENSTQPNFLKHYMNAKLQQARFLSLDEKLEVYDELIKKFKTINDPSIQEEIESLLISKSFDLMGSNDEEAMQLLDDVIEKYQDKDANVNLPEKIRFSILNNIELAIITNNDNEKYVELAEKFMSNAPDTKPLIDMLSIIKNSQDLNQDEALSEWKEAYSEYYFPDWSFQELERWAYKLEDQETKARVTRYLNTFVNQKYNLQEEHLEQHTSSRNIKNEQEGSIESNEGIYGNPYTPNPKATENSPNTEEPPPAEYIDELHEIEEEIYSEEEYQEIEEQAQEESPNPYE